MIATSDTDGTAAGRAGHTPTEWQEISMRADKDTGDAEGDAYAIGVRDGYESAVQTLDLMTGGDGEYFYSTLPGRGCPDPDAMMKGILDRIQWMASRQGTPA